MDRLIIATHNPGKTPEIREILAGLPLECLSLKEMGIVEDIEETGATYEENALLKARFAAHPFRDFIIGIVPVIAPVP